MKRSEVYALIDQERDYQIAKWGGPQNDMHHTSETWMQIVVKFTGKLAAQLFDVAYWRTRHIENYQAARVVARQLFVKIAATCVAALEQCQEIQPHKESADECTQTPDTGSKT